MGSPVTQFRPGARIREHNRQSATMNANASLEHTLLARENEWMSAWQHRDRAAADAILAEEFTLVSSPWRGDFFEGAVAGRSHGSDALRVVSIRRRPRAGIRRHGR